MTTRKPAPAEVRFWRHVEIDADSGCWLWTGCKDRHGYGRFGRGGAAAGTGSAYRWAFEHFVGPVPPGLHLDHLCRVTSCVNPAHLEPVTPLENSLRGATATKTHCPKGHPYDAANTYRGVRKSGQCAGNISRACRTCHTLRERARRAAMKVSAA